MEELTVFVKTIPNIIWVKSLETQVQFNSNWDPSTLLEATQIYNQIQQQIPIMNFSIREPTIEDILIQLYPKDQFELNFH